MLKIISYLDRPVEDEMVMAMASIRIIMGLWCPSGPCLSHSWEPMQVASNDRSSGSGVDVLCCQAGVVDR